MATTVPTLPSAPQRNDQPSTFITKANAWVAALPPWTTAVNTLGGETETNATNAAASAASASASATAASVSAGLNNFKGAYAGGTTYAAGDSVTYNGLFYFSLLGSNTGNTPDISPTYWTVIATKGARDGGADYTGGTDLVLTSTSERFQRVNMTASDLKVVLPSGMAGDQSVFVIANVGSNDFFVNDGTNDIGRVAVDEMALVSLSGTTWSIAKTDVSEIFDSIAYVFNSVGTTSPGIAVLSPTKVVLSFPTGGALKAVVLDISGSSISLGPLTTVVVSGVSTTRSSISTIDSANAFVSYGDTSTFLRGIILNISGTTITFGASTSIHSSTTVGNNINTIIDSTRALVMYERPGSPYAAARIVEFSGTSITSVGSEAGFAFSVPVTEINVIKFSSTIYHLFFIQGANLNRARLNIPVSGTGVTYIDGTTLLGGSPQYLAVHYISSENIALLSYSKGGISYISAVTISASSVSLFVSLSEAIFSDPTNMTYRFIENLVGNRFAMYVIKNGANAFSIYTFRYASQKLYDFKEFSFSSMGLFSIKNLMAKLSDGKILLAYTDPQNGGFGTAKLIMTEQV